MNNKKLWTAPDGSKWEQQSLDTIWHGNEYVRTDVGLKPVRERDDYIGAIARDFASHIKTPEPAPAACSLDFSEVDRVLREDCRNFTLSQKMNLVDLSRAIVKLARQK